MKPSILPLAIGISLASGAALSLLYFLLKKDDEIESGSTRIHSVGRKCIRVKIPKDAVGIVIGRGGATIREIQEKTHTSINFNEESETDLYRICTISGGIANAKCAESLIHDIICNQPLITTSEIKVPAKACGRIIGRNGENIRAITNTSGAKINLQSAAGESDKFGDRRIVLKGTAEQIILAKSLISEIVDEDFNLRKKCEEGASNRTPRTTKGPQYLMAGSKQTEESESHGERLSTTSSGGMMEVYVSAVESPDRFWVQVVSPSAVELDQLLVQMTEYYAKEENQELHLIENLTVGQYVAAPFLSDEKWYRAQVVNVDSNEYEPDESEVELYYVDYGDTQSASRRVVFELRADFLKLTFQAIECSLAKVKPKGSEWSTEASDLFEDLTYNAKWKVMMCNIDHYDAERTRLQTRGRREGSPVPVVNLFDINGPKDINVAEELVKNQFAVYSAPSGVKQNITTTKWTVNTSTGTVAPESSANASSAPSNRNASSGSGDKTTRSEESPAAVAATNGQTSSEPQNNHATLTVDKNKASRKVHVYEDDDDELELY